MQSPHSPSSSNPSSTSPSSSSPPYPSIYPSDSSARSHQPPSLPLCAFSSHLHTSPPATRSPPRCWSAPARSCSRSC
ncbi:hypothetical protein PSPO01_15931 [Paraphaeosphaeria sporulosa]